MGKGLKMRQCSGTGQLATPYKVSTLMDSTVAIVGKMVRQINIKFFYQIANLVLNVI